eukprot:5099453-Pyramimonas_sp.AAC.1
MLQPPPWPKQKKPKFLKKCSPFLRAKFLKLVKPIKVLKFVNFRQRMRLRLFQSRVDSMKHMAENTLDACRATTRLGERSAQDMLDTLPTDDSEGEP